MVLPRLQAPFTRLRRIVVFVSALTPLLLVYPATSRAQPMLSLPARAELVPASMRDAVPGVVSPQAAARALASAARPAPRTPFHWGHLSLFPFLSDSFIYADGIQSRPGRPSNSYVNTLNAGFQIDVGGSWTMDYAATWTTYTNRSFSESLDHNVRFSGSRQVRDWMATFSQSYGTSTTPMIETGRQTTQEQVGTTFGVGRSINYKLSVSGSISQVLSFTTTSPDTYTWSGNGTLNYQLTRKLAVSALANIGYTDPDPGVNMAFVQPSGGITWMPSPKVTFTMTAGEEIRQIFSRGVSARFTPIFTASGAYRPFQNTSVSLSASRTVQPSVLRNQVVDRTPWNVGFTQRLLRHFDFNVSYGESDAGFAAVNERVTGGRRDKSYTYRTSLGTTLLRRISIAATFSGTHNSSNTAGFAVDSTQIGVTVGARY